MLFSGVTTFNSLSADFESRLMPRSGSDDLGQKYERYVLRSHGFHIHYAIGTLDTRFGNVPKSQPNGSSSTFSLDRNDPVDSIR